ncbi:response regulator transcription factor [Streptomyces sp. H27-C3]|uniref:response regulator transcription factor n=1 Tax=Streptomyces sp. H27-C3 TaxID=3046305 RepID=UPI0024BA827E|nr:response regulator transcription factor [Streptomyces sp. H27-C3]MDJ0462871.1 response regulator transcription factor [Streptomyces sp. H27-C3]
MRSGLAALLEKEPDIEISTSTSLGALRAARSLEPRVCVVDTEGPGSPGLVAGTEVTATCGPYPECTLLVLLPAGKPGLLRRAYEADAQGYVSKEAPTERLLDGIRRVATGKRFVDDSLAYEFLDAAQSPLTRRELTVLSLAAEGADITEIADSLHLSNGTVRNYMAAITRKTGARNRVDAIRISQGAGWL